MARDDRHAVGGGARVDRLPRGHGARTGGDARGHPARRRRGRAADFGADARHARCAADGVVVGGSGRTHGAPAGRPPAPDCQCVRALPLSRRVLFVARCSGRRIAGVLHPRRARAGLAVDAGPPAAVSGGRQQQQHAGVPASAARPAGPRRRTALFDLRYGAGRHALSDRDAAVVRGYAARTAVRDLRVHGEPAMGARALLQGSGGAGRPHRGRRQRD